MGNLVPLSASCKCVETIVPKNIDEKIDVIQAQIDQIATVINEASKMGLFDNINNPGFNPNVNIDGIEIGCSLLSTDESIPLYVVDVCPDGYYVGQRKFESLIEATTNLCNKDMNALDFWAYPNGTTLREIFNNRN